MYDLPLLFGPMKMVRGLSPNFPSLTGPKFSTETESFRGPAMVDTPANIPSSFSASILRRAGGLFKAAWPPVQLDLL